MIKHSENESFLLYALIFPCDQLTTVRQEMNIFISPSNSCLMANTKIDINSIWSERTKTKL